jgi:hypothetical protein
MGNKVVSDPTYWKQHGATVYGLSSHATQSISETTT